MVQRYIDEIGLTNPLDAKRDTQKLTMLYYQLEHLPDNVKSNKKKYFDPIITDVDALQTTEVYIPFQVFVDD